MAALPLTRQRSGPAAPPEPPCHPVTLERLPGDRERWRLANGLVSVTLGPGGVEEMADATGRALLGAPLRWCRYGDRGEFWDAWDLAPTYRDHPLPWIWDGEPRWIARGPLCGHLVWRGRCGQSPVRLDGRLLAGTPWLELVLRLDWRQRHELLRLEVPLANRACRWAADAPGGVSERPTTPHTPRERSRWEVSAVSWIASVEEGRGDGLAVLLEGPQGASAGPEELGVSLLRAPTWPDPGADNGPQRLRLALMPATAGWRASAVPQQASRFRDPLWLRPWAGSSPAMAALPSQEPDVQVVGLQQAAWGGGACVLSVQNLGPCRRRLRLGDQGEVVRQRDGLHDPIDPMDVGASGNSAARQSDAVLAPWSLTFWEVRLGSAALNVDPMAAM